MDSVDDSIITTPTDTSNLSTSESSSSEVSQPTIKLRANVVKTPLKDRESKREIFRNEKRERDSHQPFIETLDQDGWRLVETTGRTAQRARSSIRRGLRLDNESRDNDRRNKRDDNYWPVGCCEPRKCRSTTCVVSRNGKPNGSIEQRHHSYESSRRSWETSGTSKGYSAGDYLRQQILEDLSSNELTGKSEEQIAEDRCNRVKAYLRDKKVVDALFTKPKDELREFKNDRESDVRMDSIGRRANRRNDLDGIRSYLRAKIRTKMEMDQWRSCEENKSFVDVGRRYSDDRRANDREDTDRTSGCRVKDEKLGRIVRHRENSCRRTKSYVIPEAVIDPEDIEIRKRFYSYSESHRKLWRTRSCLTFEKKLSLPSKASLNLDRDSENSSPADYKHDRDENEDFKEANVKFSHVRSEKKYCRRTRSDTLPDKIDSTERRAKRRSVSWSDKRKLHRRTNERLAVLADETSLNSGVNCANGTRRAKTVHGNLCSWREYKEKRRQERLLRESENRATGEDDRKICTTPIAWKNIRERLTNLGKPEDSANANIEENPSIEGIVQRDSCEGCCVSNGPKITTKRNIETSMTNDNFKENQRNGGDTTEDTEAETIIQENYLLLEKNGPESSKEMNDLWSPTISKLRLNEYGEPDVSLNYEFNMIDFGYDTIPRRRDNIDDNSSRCEWTDYNANSRVKKTDTFKIIDGSDDAALNEDACRNEALVCNYFNVNSRRMSEPKSSSNERVLNDDKNSRYEGNENFTVDRNDEISTSLSAVDAASLSGENTARDYFKRVYELLKQRQVDEKEKVRGVSAPVRCDEDTSSSNCLERQERVRRRRPRRKKDKPSYQGDEIVTVSPGLGTNDDWNVEKLLANNVPGGNLIFRRSQLQNVTGQKRQRQPAPPIPANCKINVKDISKYFDYPNKENSGPRNGVIGNNNCQIERNDPNERRRVVKNENEMGSNLSRHNGKGLTGRRTQSSGNLCDPKGKLNHVGKILVPCSSSQRERYKICGSLPNHLDDKEILEDEDARENNNVISDTMAGNLGGTLPHKKRALGVHFSDMGPTGTLDLVKHRSQDSLEGDPWRYQDGVDLDLVRCKHGNYDLVRKNQSTDAVDGDGSSRHRYGTTARTSDTVKCHRSTDLDLVGVLPKKIINESKGAVLRQNFDRQNRSTVERSGGDLSMKLTHKPDCELMKHRQFDRAIDLKLGRIMSGEPQDQGYASERSPEDEHPPSLPGQEFPNVTPESTFRVTLQKSSRGLGLSVSGGGAAGPVRVKRLFPQQPAALSNKLQSGDILLAANGVPLTGLTNYEALEVLRTTPSTVELVVCRLPGDASITPPGAPPPPPARREQPPPPPPLRILNPLPPLQIEPCGEFDIEMTKVAGSLGFTLRKVDSSALGHYVRALVREPALSDGRIRPGDKIVAVDGATLSPMSHEEAVALLRQCGPRVKLRLYRDLAQTPVSALSPTEPDHPLRPPRTSLRQEAVDMLCDLAVRKLSPGTSNDSKAMPASGAPSSSPRRLRRPNSRTPTAETEENHLTFHPINPSISIQTDGSETDQCSINTLPTNSQSETPSNDIIDPPPFYDVCDSSDSSKYAPRPSFLNLAGRNENTRFKFTEEIDLDCNAGPTISGQFRANSIDDNYYENHRENNTMTMSSEERDNDLPTEPASMPPLLPTTRTTSGVFSYKNPAYQSANPTCGGIENSAKNKIAHSSDQDIPGKVLGTEDPVGSKGLLKWKGVMFAPNDAVDEEATRGKTEMENTGRDCTAESTSRDDLCEDGNEIFMVELTRGWNSRLGFSLQPEGNSTVISVVHPDSVAAKDGRLKQGDVLIMVNDESVENMPTAEIIDLLRKIRGSIGIMVMRKYRMKKPS